MKLANVVVKEEINEVFREEVARDFEDGISEKNTAVHKEAVTH